MIKKSLKLLAKSKESDRLIAKNIGLKTQLVRRYREDILKPTEEIASLICDYFKKGGDIYIKMQKDPNKELRRQNRAMTYYLNNIKESDLKLAYRKTKVSIDLGQQEVVNKELKKLLKDNNIELQEVGI